jgi:hypothetical protein
MWMCLACSELSGSLTNINGHFCFGNIAVNVLSVQHMNLTIDTIFTSDDVLSRAEGVCSWSVVCVSSMKASERPMNVAFV